MSDNTVVLEEKSSELNEEQKWFRGTNDVNDWFTFTNPKSGKVLTATGWDGVNTLTIEGNP